MHKIDVNSLELKDKVVNISRVTKVVKGGRTFRFAALVVVGDENGHVGVGIGKSTEIPEAIRKGREDAKKNMIYIQRTKEDSVYHEIVGKFGSARVLIKPANEGTGVISGGAARAALELAGIRNIRTKSLGTNNKRNVLNATMNGLMNIQSPEQVAAKRGKTVEEIIG